ncbi:hypothetical protein [Glycomyces sp. YM15]|uniref:hypothetical protein n=1 Tax=Glycomyces sp. YM15 TaxID=2800446 RepID=UPI0019646360|nr:hypothetical protein [Glycomyces sp. YM15]
MARRQKVVGEPRRRDALRRTHRRLARSPHHLEAGLGEQETHEDIAVLVIDIDGSSAFIALASILAAGDGLYEEATVALLSTTFAE